MHQAAPLLVAQYLYSARLYAAKQPRARLLHQLQHRRPTAPTNMAPTVQIPTATALKPIAPSPTGTALTAQTQSPSPFQHRHLQRQRRSPITEGAHCPTSIAPTAPTPSSQLSKTQSYRFNANNADCSITDSTQRSNPDSTQPSNPDSVAVSIPTVQKMDQQPTFLQVTRQLTNDQGYGRKGCDHSRVASYANKVSKLHRINGNQTKAKQHGTTLHIASHEMVQLRAPGVPNVSLSKTLARSNLQHSWINLSC